MTDRGTCCHRHNDDWYGTITHLTDAYWADPWKPDQEDVKQLLGIIEALRTFAQK